MLTFEHFANCEIHSVEWFAYRHTKVLQLTLQRISLILSILLCMHYVLLVIAIINKQIHDSALLQCSLLALNNSQIKPK